MNRKEKQQLRAEHYEALAQKAECESAMAFQKSQDMVSGIPAGQPILVGHHSERAHRRALDKSWNAIGQSVKAGEKAEYYRRKAEAAAKNDAIYTEDDDAAERLQEKIAKLEQTQELMKAGNKIIRNKKLSDTEKTKQLQVLGLSEQNAMELLKPDCMGNIGFASFQLSNNNAVIRNAKERLKKVIALKNAESREYLLCGVRVVENTEANRLQLFFDSKPEESIRTELKRNGFRWTPSVGCWQSYLKSYQIRIAKEIIMSEKTEQE